jgi:4-aminobutyrate aminotransferase-like enzyme
MNPSAVSALYSVRGSTVEAPESASGDYLLDRDLNSAPQYVVNAKGNYILLDGGRRIFDGSGGAAVLCLGHANQEVIEAVTQQTLQISYCHSMFFKTQSTDSLAKELITSTDNKLERVFLICSGIFFKIHESDDILTEWSNRL